MLLSLLPILGRFAADTSATVSGACTTDCSTGLPVVSASSTNFHSLLQLALGVIAAVAVLIIVLAGLKFVTAQGDPQEVAKARSTIIYALIGLVVAVSAEIIVSFVLNKF